MASFYCYTTNLFLRLSIAMVAVCQPVLNDPPLEKLTALLAGREGETV